MPYIGQQPEIGAYKKLDSITAVNGQAAYTLQSGSANYSPASANHLIVSLNGVIQAPQDSFTVSGSTLTFASNLSTGDTIDFVLALGDVLNIGTPSDNTVTNDKLATAPTIISKGDGSSTDGAIQLNCSQNSHGVKIKSPPHSAGQSYTLVLPSTAPSNGKALITDGSGNLSFGSAGVFGSALFHIQNEHATNQSTSIGTSYTDFIFNTVKTNEITGASLSSNEVTLPAGTYFADIMICTARCNAFVSRLYNTTDSSLVLEGQLSYNAASATNNINSFIRGRFTISAEKTFKIQAAAQTAASTYGQGYSQSSSSLNETTIWMNRMALFWKVG